MTMLTRNVHLSTSLLCCMNFTFVIYGIRRRLRDSNQPICCTGGVSRILVPWAGHEEKEQRQAGPVRLAAERGRDFRRLLVDFRARPCWCFNFLARRRQLRSASAAPAAGRCCCCSSTLRLAQQDTRASASWCWAWWSSSPSTNASHEYVVKRPASRVHRRRAVEWVSEWVSVSGHVCMCACVCFCVLIIYIYYIQSCYSEYTKNYYCCVFVQLMVSISTVDYRCKDVRFPVSASWVKNSKPPICLPADKKRLILEWEAEESINLSEFNMSESHWWYLFHKEVMSWDSTTLV